MTHSMKLHKKPFELIRSGRKTIELRLFDEKRQAIRVGDHIAFSCSDDPPQTLEAQVVALHRFDSFEDLYKALPLEQCGYLPEELAAASYKDMELYYAPEEQLKFGVVGIDIRLV